MYLHTYNVSQLIQNQFVFRSTPSSYQTPYFYSFSVMIFRMTPANIFPAVLGATNPGKLGARIAFIPRLFAKRKSTPPGLEAISIIKLSFGSWLIKAGVTISFGI